MSDTEVMKKPFWGESKAPTDSQVLAFNEVPASVREKRDGEAGQKPVSVIGETLHFKGALSAGEDLIIEGTVEGTINQGTCCLTLKPNGTLLADVTATKIFIEGTVKGDLHATVSVTIRSSGKVTGNIVAPTVAIEEGSTFNGGIEMRTPQDAGKKGK
ncbi:MAG: polymer-forming cytoskeletal protein [Pseudomonadota bacterium]